jgi:hypothetical protein
MMLSSQRKHCIYSVSQMVSETAATQGTGDSDGHMLEISRVHALGSMHRAILEQY